MARSQETFGKKEKEKKRLKKRQDKALKREERKASSEGGGLDNMLAYVDEFGQIVDTPPDPTAKKKVIKAENIEIGVPKRVDQPMDSERIGRVVFFNDQKGFGFINELNSEEKYFVHVNGCTEEIAENNIVAFELEKGMKGMNAVRVRITTIPVPVEDNEDEEEEEDENKEDDKKAE